MVKEMNKRGWIRIVEASVAVLIIFATLLSVSKIRERQMENDLSETITPLLEEMAKNATLREIIIADTDGDGEAENILRDFVGPRIRILNVGYNVTICLAEEICGLDSYPEGVQGNVYAGSRIISTDLSGSPSGPKKVNLFLWRKE